MSIFLIKKVLLISTLLSIIVNFIIGCGSTYQKKSALMEDVGTTGTTSYEIRLRINAFLIKMSGKIEQTADEIASLSKDPKIRQNTLLWKMNAIPAAQRAVFISDPLAATVDLYVFCVQMADYFSEGNVIADFGPYQQMAVHTSQEIEVEFQAIIKKHGSEIGYQNMTDFVTEWVKEHEIKDLHFIRDSTVELFAKIMGDKKGGLSETIGGLEEGIDDIRQRLTIYSDFLPKLIRWQAEYLLQQESIDQHLDTLTSDFSSITHSADRITNVLEQSFSEIDRQRIESLNLIKSERIILTEYLQNERRMIFDELRSIILKELHRERIETMEQLQEIMDSSIDRVSENMYNYIDHFFIRLAQAIGILLLLVLIIGYLVKRKTKIGPEQGSDSRRNF